MVGLDRTVTIVNVDKTGRTVSWSMLGQSKQVYIGEARQSNTVEHV